MKLNAVDSAFVLPLTKYCIFIILSKNLEKPHVVGEVHILVGIYKLIQSLKLYLNKTIILMLTWPLEPVTGIANIYIANIYIKITK